MLKEWRNLDATYMSMSFHRGGSRTTEEKQCQDLKDLNSRIILLEYRVFGNNVSDKYPDFDRPEHWLRWRRKSQRPRRRYY